MNHLLLDLARFQNLYPHSTEVALGLLKSTAIVTMAGATATLLRGRSARTRNWVWRCALAGLLGLALWQFLPAQTQAKTLVWRAAPTAPPNEPVPAGPSRAVKMSGIAGASPIATGRPVAGLLGNVERWAMPGWAAISAGLVGTYLLRANLGLRRLRHHSVPDMAGTSPLSERLEIRTTGLLNTPLLAGFSRPTIYLPAEAVDWTEEKRRYVLRHEMAHWSRGDLWWQLAGTLAAALWWWNPLSWAALGRLKIEAEEAADDLVVLQEGRAEAYARLLVEMATERPEATAGVIPMLGQSPLEQRIRGILNHSTDRNTIGAWSGSLLGGLSILILLCMSAGIVLGEADLTNREGEIVHWQANPANNQLAQGNFQKTGGKLDGWAATPGATSLEHNAVRLKAGPEAASIEAVLPVQPDWKWLTVVARLRPGGSGSLEANQQATVSFMPEDDGGKSTGPTVVIQEDRREGYTNWTSRIRTMPVAAGTAQLRVQMRVTPGPGQLDCSEILVIPSKPSDELDHRLVDRFFKAIEEGDGKTVEAMLQEEPKLVNSRKGRADNGTPLILCAWLESPAIAQILVDHGADLEATDMSSWKSSALAWCGWWGSPKTAEVLLRAGANAKFKSLYNVTPLSAAEAGKESNKASKATPEAFDQTIALFKAAQK